MARFEGASCGARYPAPSDQVGLHRLISAACNDFPSGSAVNLARRLAPGAAVHLWGQVGAAPGGESTAHSLTVWEAAAHMAIISAPEANLTTMECRQ